MVEEEEEQRPPQAIAGDTGGFQCRPCVNKWNETAGSNYGVRRQPNFSVQLLRINKFREFVGPLCSAPIRIWKFPGKT